MRPLDPASFSPNDRRSAIAEILARGVRRLLSRPTPADAGPPSVPEKPQNSAENSLELADDLRLTVHTS